MFVKSRTYNSPMDAVAEKPAGEPIQHTSGPELSVIIPVLDEQDSVEELYRELVSVLGPLDRRYEIIFVDDGSTDNTFPQLAEIAAHDQHVSILSLRRRFGKTAAMVAGFRESRGAIVITMDGDLQDDPNEIPRFVDQIESGSDLVVGWKRERLDPANKTIPSKVFNGVVRRASGLELHDFNCGFKAYRREVLDD